MPCFIETRPDGRSYAADPGNACGLIKPADALFDQPQSQGNIERSLRTLKNRILLQACPVWRNPEVQNTGFMQAPTT